MCTVEALSVPWLLTGQRLEVNMGSTFVEFYLCCLNIAKSWCCNFLDFFLLQQAF